MTKPHNISISITLIIALVVGVLGAAESAAQTNVLDSDPLRARKLIVYDMFGGYIGPSFNGQGGTILTNCDCEFTGGAETGIALGLVFEKLTRSKLIWGVTLGFENKSVQGIFHEVEGVLQTAPSTGQQYLVPITFGNTADVTLNYLTAMPYLKYNIIGSFFARAGASVSYIFSSNLTHTKTLESETVRFPNGETAFVSIPGAESNSVELQNGDIPEIQQLQFGLVIGAGADIRLSKKMFLSPILQYSHPFTTVSPVGDFSVRSFQIIMEARFIL